MAVRTGKVIMAKNIHLDKSYKNVLSYSESQMVTLLTQNAVNSFTNCSFLRPGENAIKLDMSYNSALRCNYIGFQNPDYSNKWFFGFIDEIEYVSDRTVIVRYTIDEFSTWWDYWQPEQCMVEREHTSDDTIGNNIVPEGFDLGSYVGNGASSPIGFGSSSIYYCLLSIYSPKNQTTLATNICGIGISGGLYFTPNWQTLANMVDQYANIAKSNEITMVYAVPSGLAGLMTDNAQYETWGQGIDEDSYYRFTGRNSVYTVNQTFNPPTAVDGYTPVNQKLLTSPYVCCVLSNSAGSSNVLAYEYFTNRTVQIETDGTPSVGCSIISYPVNYKNRSKNRLEGLSWGKYPTLSWSGDAYTNWLTQNAVNLGLGVLGDASSIVLGGALVATGNPLGWGSIAGGLGGTFNREKDKMQHNIVPYTSTGNVNLGDVMTSSGANCCYLYPVSIKAQFARRIDNYFTRYGYRVDDIKVPNQMGRQYWNFVKIAPGEDIGHSTINDYFSVPVSSMETINKIYQNGVTIWHDHSSIGNFNLNNAIV